MHKQYLAAFVGRASYLLDWSTVRAANATFYADYMFDERRPASPSRRYGIAPD